MKKYLLPIIKNEKEIDSCPEFEVSNIQWNSIRAPRTTGRMGYIPSQGIVVKMKCEEVEPLRECTGYMERVCKDSAMEAFFAFTDWTGAKPDEKSLYFNFEINANGALYAKTGYGRADREQLLEEEIKLVNPKAWIDEDVWYIKIVVPNRLITRFSDKEALLPGDIIYCNFYKISENPQIEHYMSYNYIDSEKPNFHLPSCFAQAVVTEN